MTLPGIIPLDTSDSVEFRQTRIGLLLSFRYRNDAIHSTVCSYTSKPMNFCPSTLRGTPWNALRITIIYI